MVFSNTFFLNEELISYHQAKLVPADDITVYYNASGSLARVIPEFNDFIWSTVKQPLKPFSARSATETVIIEDVDKVMR